MYAHHHLVDRTVSAAISMVMLFVLVFPALLDHPQFVALNV